MKSEDLQAAVPYLSREEQDLLLHLGEAVGEDGVTVAMDMDIRHGLTAALGEMGNAVQMLLVLLNRHRISLPDTAMPAYGQLLESIATAATDGATWVCRSHEFDQSALLALLPEPSMRLQ